jgi:hypothetical protein
MNPIVVLWLDKTWCYSYNEAQFRKEFSKGDSLPFLLCLEQITCEEDIDQAVSDCVDEYILSPV